MLQEKFRSYVRERSLCTADERILLAVSGGVDSMVMLSLFVRCGYRVGVAHCNFQLRGREADEDDVLVEQQAARYGVPYFGARFDTLAEVAATGDSVEMAARRLRYGWFDKLCDEHGYDKIAIAHHADDSVETFFINLIRGTGLRGLTGIHVVNGRLIRPLLFSTRREIVDYALANKIPYREDSSNASTKYLRNKFRLGIVPRIKEISPQFTETMTSNVERLTSAQSFIDRGIELIRQHAVRTEGDRTVIEMSLIDPLLPLHFVIFELMRGMGFNGEVIDSLARVRRGARLGQALLFQRQRSLYRPGQDHRHADSRRRELRDSGDSPDGAHSLRRGHALVRACGRRRYRRAASASDRRAARRSQAFLSAEGPALERGRRFRAVRHGRAAEKGQRHADRRQSFAAR